MADIHPNWNNPECFTDANYARAKGRRRYEGARGDRYKPHPGTKPNYYSDKDAVPHTGTDFVSSLPSWLRDTGSTVPFVPTDENANRVDFDIDLSGN